MTKCFCIMDDARTWVCLYCRCRGREMPDHPMEPRPGGRWHRYLSGKVFDHDDYSEESGPDAFVDWAGWYKR